jgi:hypothetical protein
VGCEGGRLWGDAHRGDRIASVHEPNALRSYESFGKKSDENLEGD